MKTYKIGICEKIHYKISFDNTRLLKPTNCYFYENVEAQSEEEAVEIAKNMSNYKYIFHISTSEDEKDVTLQLARHYPVIKSELAEKLYSEYSKELFIGTKTLKDYLKNNILVFNRHGIEIKIYPLDKNKYHSVTLNNVLFTSLSHDDPLQNIWRKMHKEYPIELKDWRYLQNLDYPVTESNCTNIIGRFFERTEPIYSKLNFVRLFFGNNLDFKWFKGKTPEEVQDRVDQYCYYKNLTAEAEILWPIHKSINSGAIKRPYQIVKEIKDYPEKKKRKGYINKKKERDTFYAKKKWYKVKALANKGKSRNQPKQERLVCVAEWRNNNHIPSNLIEITRMKYSSAQTLINEDPTRFTFSSKSTYKKLQKQNKPSYPQYMKTSKVNTKTTLEDGTVVKGNRRQRRFTEQKKHIKQLPNITQSKHRKKKSKNNKNYSLGKIKQQKLKKVA